MRLGGCRGNVFLLQGAGRNLVLCNYRNIYCFMKRSQDGDRQSTVCYRLKQSENLLQTVCSWGGAHKTIYISVIT